MQSTLIANQSGQDEYVPMRTSSRWLIGAIRVLLLLLGVAAVAAAAVLDPVHEEARDGAIRYVCPMHPEVTANAKGSCPICRMALEPVPSADAKDAKNAKDAKGAARAIDPRAYENLRSHDVFDVARVRSLPADASEWRGAAWVTPDGAIVAVLYQDQVAALAPDETGSFVPSSAPKMRATVRRTKDAAAPWDPSMSRVRFELDRASKAPAGAPGLVGWIELSPRPRKVLTVPAPAVLRAPEGPYVLLVGEGFVLEKRPIAIGETFGKAGLTAVLSGLHIEDRVVARAAFFLDAERKESAMAEMHEVPR
ncbi:heavy metal-binding domain-containing protein [Pendulispora albinea]|uniref:Heavy metal binding domain-containing protein n=1 Tax=Pendulispora albinea TaxID=2741071 RepID=A0ABZ2MBI0_9BACT